MAKQRHTRKEKRAAKRAKLEKEKNINALVEKVQRERNLGFSTEFRLNPRHMDILGDFKGVKPKQLKKKPKAGSKYILTPPLPLLDLVYNFLIQYGFYEAAACLEESENKDWKHKAEGLPILLDVYLRWQAQHLENVGAAAARRDEALKERIEGFYGAAPDRISGVTERIMAAVEDRKAKRLEKGIVDVAPPKSALDPEDALEGAQRRPVGAIQATVSKIGLKRKASSESNSSSEVESSEDESSAEESSGSESEEEEERPTPPANKRQKLDGSDVKSSAVKSSAVKSSGSKLAQAASSATKKTIKKSSPKATKAASSDSSETSNTSESSDSEDDPSDDESPTQPTSGQPNADLGDETTDNFRRSSDSSATMTKSDVERLESTATKRHEKAKSPSSSSSLKSSSDSDPASSEDSGSVSSEGSVSSSESDSDSSSSSDNSKKKQQSNKATTSKATKLQTEVLVVDKASLGKEVNEAAVHIDTIHGDQAVLPATKANIKELKKQAVPFSRIPADIKVQEKFSSNAYVPYDYANKAHQDLIVTKGKGFTKEKNKKKRGQNFKGGFIDVNEKRGIKFED